ncbi:MAG: prepilin-type N-terminal cleavage/methylation domain-containing protein [Acidobacteriota bacterium]
MIESRKSGTATDGEPRNSRNTGDILPDHPSGLGQERLEFRLIAKSFWFDLQRHNRCSEFGGIEQSIVARVYGNFEETVMRREQGFSLIELLIVVVIIGVIAAIAIPGLQRARRYAQSGSAIQSLRTITTAENLYERRFKVYATLTDLAPEGTVDTNLASGSKSGYSFSITLVLDSNGKATNFNSNADPQFDLTTAEYFFVDTTAVIRHNAGAAADASSDPIPK